MAYGHAERNLALIRQLEAETRKLLGSLNHLDPEQSAWLQEVPEWFGGGALPRKDLREAAEELTANRAGLVVVGEPTIEKRSTRRLRVPRKW